MKLTTQEQQLVNLVQELRSEGPRQLSRLGMAVVHWFKIKQDVLNKKEEKRRRKKRKRRRRKRNKRTDSGRRKVC